MKTLFLVRHGQTDWNIGKRIMGQKDVPLNATGREQAMALKEQIAPISFDICYCSPLSRAKETAEIICSDKCKIICDANLMERHAGKAEGKVVNDWSKYDGDTTAESATSTLERAQNFLKMIKESEYEKILIVSHNGFLKNLRHCILNKTGDVEYGIASFSNCGYEKYEI